MSAGIGNKYASYNNTERLLDKPKRDWVKKGLRSYAGRRTIIRYNQFRLMNQSERLTETQYNELGQIFRPDNKYQVGTVKNFLKQDEVKQVSNIELAKIMEHKGITLDFIVDEQKELLELSKKEKQLNVTHKVIESFKNDLGLNNKVTISETRQTNSNLVDNFNKAKQTITVTSEKQGQISNNEPDVKVGPDKDSAA